MDKQEIFFNSIKYPRIFLGMMAFYLYVIDYYSSNPVPKRRKKQNWCIPSSADITKYSFYQHISEISKLVFSQIKWLSWIWYAHETYA